MGRVLSTDLQGIEPCSDAEFPIQHQVPCDWRAKWGCSLVDGLRGLLCGTSLRRVKVEIGRPGRSRLPYSGLHEEQLSDLGCDLEAQPVGPLRVPGPT